MIAFVSVALFLIDFHRINGNYDLPFIYIFNFTFLHVENWDFIMSIWIAKAVVQKTISFLPFKHHLNYFFQKYITKGVVLTDFLFEDKLTHCRNHLSHFEKFGSGKKEKSLELGTGWYPIIPIGLYLSGFEQIYSIDIERLLTVENIYLSIDKFIDYHKRGKLISFIKDLDEQRFEKLQHMDRNIQSATALLKAMQIEVSIADARKTIYATDSFDLINSNNTFEHIPEDILRSILFEMKRTLSQDGLMSHFIDMSDHFAHFDKSISIYNFLKYSDASWQRIDNSIQPQNRLRYYDYKKMFNGQGLKIIYEETEKGEVSVLKSIQRDEKFTSSSIEETAISHCLFVLKK